ncbi:MAG: hypothetical protein RDU47_09055, partial [Spirochaetia bacterium]|nr:hypothetical protein [Spirochaetia bacterium]
GSDVDAPALLNGSIYEENPFHLAHGGTSVITVCDDFTITVAQVEGHIVSRILKKRSEPFF